ncbi:MAG: hypothetical protein U0570_12780 [Phycisphaerales bacterium]
MSDAALSPLANLPRRDTLWLAPCILCLWSIGAILAMDDSGRLFRGDPTAATWAAVGMALGVFGIWSWRRWLIREEMLRPAHDTADDILWFTGAVGAIAIYIAVVPPRKLLPPNATLCILSGLAGARLLYSGWTRRVGNTLHCSRCNYEITDTSMPRRCPECSGVWAHRLVRGRIDRNTNLIGVGIVLLFLASLSPFPRLEVSRSFIRRQFSTNWLIAQAIESLNENAAHDPGLWRELSKRTFTDQQIQPLTDRIQRLLEKGPISDPGAEWWLEQLVFDGRAPRKTADDFMDRYLTFQLRLPVTAFTGRSVPVVVESLELRRLPRDRIALFLESVVEDTDPTPLARSSKWELLSDSTLRPARQQPMGFPPTTPNPPNSEALGEVAAVAHALPGTTTVRAKLWVALIPPGTSLSQSPASIASLYTDPTAKAPVLWLRRYDLQADIRFNDRGRSGQRASPTTPPAAPPQPAAVPPQRPRQ